MTSWISKTTLLVLAAALAACSNPNDKSATALVDGSGKHAAGWTERHWIQVAGLKGTDPSGAAAAVAASSPSCAQCHGADLLGGVSKVSCFSTQLADGTKCHPDVLGHPATWRQAIQHGQLGAMAPAGISSGFAYCATCHGADFRGGPGNAVSCFSCHGTAPHAPAPWIGGNVSHVTSGASNAAVCAQCHAGGRNFGAVLTSTAAAASPAPPTPDCFNNTLCHGGAVDPPHQASVTYLGAANHGVDAAGRNATHTGYGLALCRECHADAGGRFNLRTNNMASGCETCHAQGTAHPTPWLPGRSGTPSSPNTTSHAQAGNHGGSDCTPCHGATLQGAGLAPSCSSTDPVRGVRCHAASPVSQPDNCLSCHPSFVLKRPNNGAADAHSAHFALNIGCDACHSGGGVDGATGLGNPLHANGFLNVSSSAYRGRRGGFAFTGERKCSNVSCHGGKLTPVWENTGSIDVTRDCLLCHEQGNAGNAPQTPELNSFYSGFYNQVFPAENLHQFHLNADARYPHLPVVCTDCHSLTTQQHFGGLAQRGFPTAPGNTPGDTVRRDVTGYQFNAATSSYPGNCLNVTCHTLANKNASWDK